MTAFRMLGCSLVVFYRGFTGSSRFHPQCLKHSPVTETFDSCREEGKPTTFILSFRRIKYN